MGFGLGCLMYLAVYLFGSLLYLGVGVILLLLIVLACYALFLWLVFVLYIEALLPVALGLLGLLG